jgi:hypothetical protein
MVVHQRRRCDHIYGGGHLVHHYFVFLEQRDHLRVVFHEIGFIYPIVSFSVGCPQKGNDDVWRGIDSTLNFICVREFLIMGLKRVSISLR